jgi:vacuolar-type H+-ATPase subunit H
MELKESRNKLVHEGEAPSRDKVEQCLNTATKVVEQHIKSIL